MKSGTGGAQNVHWVARPNAKLPAGIYILRDSDPATRSHNGQSDGVGFAKVISGPKSVSNKLLKNRLFKSGSNKKSQTATPTATQSGGRQQALDLSGNGNYVEIAENVELDITHAITMEAWIKPNTLTNGYHSIVSKSSNSPNTGYIFPRFDSGNQLVFYLYINGWKILNVGAVIPTGQWHHVAATYDGQRMKIYVDGVLQKKQLAVSGPIATNQNKLVIGNQTSYNEWYDGLVDEVRVWNRALPLEEIQSLMSKELSGDEQGLVAYYNFDGLDAKGHIPDRSGNGHRGVFFNGAKLTGAAAQVDTPQAITSPSSTRRSYSEWNTNFNKMVIIQKGAKVSGHFDYHNGKVIGMFEGRTLKGWWTEDDDSKDCGPNNAWSGPFILNFDADGRSFTGAFGKSSKGQKTFESIPPDQKWSGNRTSGSIKF